MRSARLAHALDTGAVVLPPRGRIAVLRPEGEDDIAPLPAARLDIVTGFRPVWDRFAARGLALHRRVPHGVAASVVCLPRARALAAAMLAEANAATVPGGPVIVDGARTDGVETALRHLRAAGVATGPVEAKAHGKTFAFAAGAAALPAREARPVRTTEGYVTLPGVFSADGADRGSALLAAALPATLGPVVGDLGAGWGFLSLAVLQRADVRAVHLIEAEADALDCARANVTDPRAVFHWADATAFRPAAPFDAVVCNPPFHTGRAADPALGLAFIRAAQRMLKREGTLFLVANRGLPYRRALEALFAEVAPLGSDPAFALWRAGRPIQPTRVASTRGERRRA
jgi:16S rRNA (guanine1207-N2)-methyltransferase